MTTTVTVQAHCGADKEVFVSMTTANGWDTYTVQDGETKTYYIWGDKTITISENIKGE